MFLFIVLLLSVLSVGCGNPAEENNAHYEFRTLFVTTLHSKG
jgi:hypothetical protein